MTEKDIIQVYLDLNNGCGCWNCKHDKGSICEVNYIGTVGYVKGISHCGLKNWESNNEDWSCNND